MELHQVRYFLAVYEARNFTRAAERCHVSQPALTNAIKKLEAELDGPLFHRDRAGARLTVLGELVLPRFRRLAEDSQMVQQLAFNHRHVRRVPLRVGVLDTIGPAWLSTLLQSFRREAPEVELELHVGGHSRLLQDLEDGTIELAITNAHDLTRDWAVVTDIYRENYVVVLPTGDPLASEERVRLRDLAGKPYIDRLSCELRNTLAEACAEQGVELYPSFRTANEAWIECLVQVGMGLALMPEHSLLSADTVRRTLVEPALSRQISMVRSADRAASPAAKLMWRTLSPAP